MPSIKLSIVELIEDGQPDWVIAKFTDAYNREQTIHEKEPVISSIQVAKSDIPIMIDVDCEILQTWEEPSGRSLSKIQFLWAIESTEGETTFIVETSALNIFPIRSSR